MTVQVEFIPREGAAPKGKEWDSFLAQQAKVLDRRSADGWELASTVSIISTSRIWIEDKRRAAVLTEASDVTFAHGRHPRYTGLTLDYETIAVEREGALMTVRFNRPDKRNAINRRMHAELQDLCHQLTDDTDTRVVIFTGAGKGFSSGADTSEWTESQSADELAVRHISGVGSRTSTAIEYLEQITIAAVHGFAVGGGLVLAICCDMRIAGEETWFSIPEVELGLPLGWNALPRLAREIGHARALELTITCDKFDARTAHDYGLVTHLVPEKDVQKKARELADKILSRPALPVALTKATMKAIRKSHEMGDVAYSDTDMLLYARLMAQRVRRLEKEGRA